jgi:nucleoside-diphosphate-sugar epimerase
MSDWNGITLITGATGYIGSFLAERLLSRGREVRTFVRSREKASNLAAQGAEVVVGDLTEPDSLEAAVDGVSRVFHAAAAVDEQASREALFAVNAAGTESLVQGALRQGRPHFIHLSSCAVYGSIQAFGIDEATPLRTGASDYHDSKVAAERAVWSAAAAGLPVTIARPSQVYGPGSTNFTIRPVEAIRSGSMMLIDGGHDLCKPIFIDNLLDGLEALAAQPAAIGEAFNLTDGYTVPWRLFFGAYASMLDVDHLPSVPYPLAWLVALLMETRGRLTRRRPSLTRSTVRSLRSTNSFSNRKARRMLGWSPRVGFEMGMERTKRWLLEVGYLD